MSAGGADTPELLTRLRKLAVRSSERLSGIFEKVWARRHLREGVRKLEPRQGTAPRAARGRSGPREGPRTDDGGRRHSDVGQEQTELDVQVSKFDIARIEEVAEEARTLPWGYGKTRVTAMFIDADRLFAYWEVTDPAIEDAREGLGPGGPGAWLNLRVYDVTGRIFDGTNARSYLDQQIARTDRQWFFDLGKPGSSAVVELGMKSHEGYFVKIVRSARVDFPRRQPSEATDVEWLTVRPDTGELAHEATEHRQPSMASVVGEGGAMSVADREVGRTHEDTRSNEEYRVLLPGERIARRWDWQVVFPGDWQEVRRTLSWEGPVLHTSWEAGPLFVPVELPSRIEEYHTGEVRIASRDGMTRMIYGPWQVVIRGLGAHAERRVLGVWEMSRTWTEGPVRLTTARWDAGPVGDGASEILAGGASEILLRGASERRLGGASEVFYLGASEVRLGGASEVSYLGASELRLRGASEIRLGGASEVGARGASERRLGGASELRFGGASERAGEGGGTGYPPIESQRTVDRGGGGSREPWGGKE